LPGGWRYTQALPMCAKTPSRVYHFAQGAPFLHTGTRRAEGGSAGLGKHFWHRLGLWYRQKLGKSADT
jgi:hypothetical protein